MGVSTYWGCTLGAGTFGFNGLIWFADCSATAVGLFLELFFGLNKSAAVMGKAGRSSQRVYWSWVRAGPWYCRGRVRMDGASTFGSWKSKGRGLGSSERGAPSLDCWKYWGIGLAWSLCGTLSFGSWKDWRRGLGSCVHRASTLSGSWWHWGATTGSCVHLEWQNPFSSWLGMGCSWLTISRVCLCSSRGTRSNWLMWLVAHTAYIFLTYCNSLALSVSLLRAARALSNLPRYKISWWIQPGTLARFVVYKWIRVSPRRTGQLTFFKI